MTTPKYSLAINGGIYGRIKGKRGLSQRDPLSPLFFVIGVEYFSRFIK